MCELGNTVSNQIYEGACEELGAKKPGPSSARFVCFSYVTLVSAAQKTKRQKGLYEG